jgi:hypothetical protein
MPADMVPIHQRSHRELIVLGISLQAHNPLFHRLAKPGTNLKAFIGNAIGDHGWHLDAEIYAANKYLVAGLKFFLLVPILEKTNLRRQITVESAAGNVLSRNRTVGPDSVENRTRGRQF